MVKVDDKGKALASESEAEKASVKNADTETAASEQVNAQMSSGNSEGEAKKDESNEQVNTKEESNNKNVPASISGGEEKIEENGKVDKILASGSESEHMASIKNVDVETTASGLVNVEGTAAISGGVGNNKEENKKDQSNEKEVDNKLSATGGSSKKRKRKVKKVVKKPSTQSAVTETAASEVVKMDVEAPAAISGGEENKGENKKEDNKVADNTLATKGKKLRNRKKRKTMKGAADLVPAKNTDKPGTSTKEKDTKKSDSMGMIFMCSSKTKEDCYRYKILGLPASKKDMVAKIYKGMRLFLFDIDLKLLYGIYRAAEPGGYNIEPKAFKSAFPSQVRFSVMEDCLPLAEEKFKAVIKDNYYGKNKFDCQLKAEQVKNLCKLFKATTKSRDSKSVGKVPKTEVRTPVDRSRERRQGRDRDRPLVPDRDRRQGRDKDRRQGRDRDESRQGRDRDRRQGRDRDRRQGRGRDRRPELGGGRIVSRADNIYERRALLPPRLPPRLPSPVPQTYAYERPLDMDYYRRDTQLEHHERRLLDFELNRREEMVYREPLVYRDPVPAPEPPLTYHEPLYGRAALPSAHEPPLSYHEPVYTRAAPPVYHLPQLYRY